MSGFFPEHEIQRVRDATDIVSLIRDYVTLRRAGSAYKALCPFHDEKTPSFHVNPTKQIFKCFGCNVGGDVFTFLMKHDGLAFNEAVTTLAQRAGIQLTEAPGTRARRADAKTINDVLEWAARLYARALAQSEAAAPTRGYVTERGISSASVDRFLLGYAPDAWDTLLQAAPRQKIGAADLARAGLVLTNESGRTYDRFRNRLMFPIRDARGRVIAFGARSLDGSEPKYLNSPETAAFQKSRTLYGIYESLDALRKTRRVTVVEGYTDVIMAHQHGAAGVVAVLGTALSRDHVRLLRRYVDEVLLLFDADEAGQNSAERSIDAFVADGMPLRLGRMPEGLDPCDLFLRDGAAAPAQLEKDAEDVIAFKLRRALAANRGQLESAGALDGVLSTIALMPDAVAREAALRHVAEATRASVAALMTRLVSLRRGDERPARTARRGAAMPRWDAARKLLGLMLAAPAHLDAVRAGLNLEWIEAADVRAVFAAAFALAHEGVAVDAGVLLARTAEPQQRQVMEECLVVEVSEEIDAGEECASLITRLRALHAERHAPALRKNMREADAAGRDGGDALTPAQREAGKQYLEHGRQKQRGIGFGRELIR